MPRRPATLRGRLRRPGGTEAPEDEYIEVEPGELSSLFTAPGWLRDLGVSAWLLVGVAAALAGAVWFMSETQSIGLPVITAAIIASVTEPIVTALERRRVPRSAGAVIVFLAIAAIGFGIGLMVLAGIASESGSIARSLEAGAAEIEQLAQDLGVDPGTATDAREKTTRAVSNGFESLTSGVVSGIEKLASVVMFLSFAAISLFFLLKDGPTIRGFAERHMGVPQQLGHSILARVDSSMRGYFGGVTIVAAWSAVIVGIGALALGVPLPGTIAVVTFVGGFVPYLGAWTAGVFAVLIALGGGGAEDALAMGVIVLLANGVLQQLVQPVAYGAALGLHPLAVLIVTVAGGSLFGTMGLILAAPLTSAAVRIWSDLSAARAAESPEPEEPPERPEPGAPAPA